MNYWIDPRLVMARVVEQTLKSVRRPSSRGKGKKMGTKMVVLDRTILEPEFALGWWPMRRGKYPAQIRVRGGLPILEVGDRCEVSITCLRIYRDCIWVSPEDVRKVTSQRGGDSI